MPANRTELSDSLQEIRRLSPMITLDQQVSLLIESEGIVHLRTRELSDDWTTEAIQDGLTLELNLPHSVRPTVIADWLDQPEISLLLDQIIGEMGEEVDQSQTKLIGTLTDEGQNTYAALHQELTDRWYGPWSESTDTLTRVDPAEWLTDTHDEIFACSTMTELQDYINEATDHGHPQTDQDGHWIVLDPAGALEYAQEVWLTNMTEA